MQNTFVYTLLSKSDSVFAQQSEHSEPNLTFVFYSRSNSQSCESFVGVSVFWGKIRRLCCKWFRPPHFLKILGLLGKAAEESKNNELYRKAENTVCLD